MFKLVSIRAPRERGDRNALLSVSYYWKFQYAPRVNGATLLVAEVELDLIVSIRAPRERGDWLSII